MFTAGLLKHVDSHRNTLALFNYSICAPLTTHF